MQITNEFTLELPARETYELLLDLERVTPCMPGAVLGEELEDGARAVTVKVKLGPMRFSYDGTVRIAEQDPAALRAVLQGAAREVRGQGNAEASIAMNVAEASGGSRVTAVADIDLSGRAAQMGHGAVETVTRQLIGQMTRCLSEKFVDGGAAAGGAPPAPADAAPAGSADAHATAATAAGQASAVPASEPEPLKASALLLAVAREWFASLRKRLRRS